jgi:hypothetical protein
MKFPIKFRRRHVKKAVLVSIYALSAFAMLIWTVAPGMGL